MIFDLLYISFGRLNKAMVALGLNFPSWVKEIKIIDLDEIIERGLMGNS